MKASATLVLSGVLLVLLGARESRGSNGRPLSKNCQGTICPVPVCPQPVCPEPVCPTMPPLPSVSCPAPVCHPASLNCPQPSCPQPVCPPARCSLPPSPPCPACPDCHPSNVSCPQPVCPRLPPIPKCPSAAPMPNIPPCPQPVCPQPVCPKPDCPSCPDCHPANVSCPPAVCPALPPVPACPPPPPAPKIPPCPSPTCPTPVCPAPSCPPAHCPPATVPRCPTCPDCHPANVSCPQPVCPPAVCPTPSCPPPSCPAAQSCPAKGGASCAGCLWKVLVTYDHFESYGFYKGYNHRVDWQQAKTLCEADGGHLGIINSANEAQLFKLLYQKNAMSGWVFIGYHDLNQEGKYETVLGEPLSKSGFVNWASGQPDNLGNEDCGTIDSNGMLNDGRCDWKTGFICEVSEEKVFGE